MPRKKILNEIKFDSDDESEMQQENQPLLQEAAAPLSASKTRKKREDPKDAKLREYEEIINKLMSDKEEKKNEEIQKQIKEELNKTKNVVDKLISIRELQLIEKQKRKKIKKKIPKILEEEMKKIKPESGGARVSEEIKKEVEKQMQDVENKIIRKNGRKLITIPKNGDLSILNNVADNLIRA